jgi:polyisoprenoid-binding protein YceI
MNTWKIDPMHSEVQFKVKHLMISNVTGDFKEFDAELVSDGESFENANISFSAKIDSVSTGNGDRDNHLKSGDFFEADKYPELKFSSTSFEKIIGEKFLLKGNLTIKDVTNPIELDVEYGGTMVDFYNNEKAGFDIYGKIKRKDFGLTWDGITEAGGIVVSDEVRLLLNVQLGKQA